MRLAVFSVFAASPKQPFGEVFARILEAFGAAVPGAVELRFRMADGGVATPLRAAIGMPKPVSSIARVLKSYPDFMRFAHRAPNPAGGEPVIHMLSNIAADGSVAPVDAEPLLAIAAGVPRSFPFHRIWLHVTAPGFSEHDDGFPETPDANTWRMLARANVDLGAGAPTRPGIALQDAWWVTGRQRSMAALRVIEADPDAKKLPPMPPDIAALMSACGKVRKTVQVPVVAADPGTRTPPDALRTPAGQQILEVIRAWRARLPDIAETLPHDVTASFDTAIRLSPGAPYGPRKPALERVFAPMGYSIRGETGAFRLRRRTEQNLTIELNIDVGTWSDHFHAALLVVGMLDGVGFKAAMGLPPCRQTPRGIVRGIETYGQITVGTAERWSELVENLSVLVKRLEDGLVPEIETITGAAPAWFNPEAAA